MRRIALAVAATTALTFTALGAGIQSASAANYNWSGFYAGLNAGSNWGTAGPSTTAVDPTCSFWCGGAPSGIADLAAAGNHKFNTKGFTGGIQGGYNWQSGNILVGVEVDFEYFRSSGSDSVTARYSCAGCAGFGPFIVNSSLKTDWLFTARPRIGTVANNWLFYVTGGWAVTKVKADWSYTDTAFGGGPYTETASASATKSGWTVGGGIETALPGNNLLLGVEYLYLKFGSISTTSNNFAGGGGAFPLVTFSHSADLTSNIVRARLSKKF